MKLRKKKILYGKQQSTTKKGEVYMGKAKKCIIAICIAVLLVGVGAGTIIYRQAQGNESLWGTFAKDHKDLVKKYSDWFNKDGEFYFKIAEGKKDTAWWDKIFDKVANKEEGTKIPEELIKAMTTEQLLDACSRHPLAIQFYDDYEEPYRKWEDGTFDRFNGLEALIHRKDVWTVCYKDYMNSELPQDKNEDEEKIEFSLYRQCLDADILLSPDSYDHFTKKQRQRIIKRTSENADFVEKSELLMARGLCFSSILCSIDGSNTHNPSWSKEKEVYNKSND